jgi:hypothetical protein
VFLDAAEIFFDLVNVALTRWLVKFYCTSMTMTLALRPLAM